MKKQEKIPDWTDNVLQGIAYWIGYKKQYYRFYPLTEGAIVAEMLSLLSTSQSGYKSQIHAEVMIKNICKKSTSKKRFDIVISEETLSENNIQSVIEVKRLEAPKKELEKDFKKLIKYLSCIENNNVRAFVILVSQNTKPTEYISAKGNAKKRTYNIAGYDNYYLKVRRVCKATNKFYTEKNNKKANYVCLFEILKK